MIVLLCLDARNVGLFLMQFRIGGHYLFRLFYVFTRDLRLSMNEVAV